MRKRLLITLLCTSTILGLVACSSSDKSDIDTSNLSVQETQDMIDDLKAENERLTDEIEKTKEKEDKLEEVEAWNDDYVIAFTDEDLLDRVRDITGVHERDITYGDVKHITEFEGYGTEFTSIEALKYFTGMCDLDITLDEKVTDLKPLNNLANLERMCITADGNLDVKHISNLTNLKELEIYASGNLIGLEKLDGLTNLDVLDLGCDGDMSGVDVLNKLTNLTDLSIYYRCGTINVGDFKNSSNLKRIYIWANTIENIDKLVELSNLTSLEINTVGTYDIDKIPNLTELTDLIISADSIENLNKISDLSNLRNLEIRSSGNLDLVGLSEVQGIDKLRLFAKEMYNIEEVSILESLKILDIYCYNNIDNLESLLGLPDTTEINMMLYYLSDDVVQIYSRDSLSEYTKSK